MSLAAISPILSLQCWCLSPAKFLHEDFLCLRPVLVSHPSLPYSLSERGSFLLGLHLTSELSPPEGARRPRGLGDCGSNHPFQFNPSIFLSGKPGWNAPPSFFSHVCQLPMAFAFLSAFTILSHNCLLWCGDMEPVYLSSGCISPVAVCLTLDDIMQPFHPLRRIHG